MSEPFVSVEKYDGVACVRVRIGEKFRRYVLTKAGCIQAGRELFHAGAESWMNSSSVDFPQEVKRGFKWDVHELMDQGFREEMEKADAPRKSMIAKMVAFCAKSDEFLTSLTEAEFKLWEKALKEHGEEG